MPTDLSKLNVQQKAAVLESINSNVILLAAAGSGKTTVLVKRTEYLISDLGVDPCNIMLFTFTNKAEKEIKKRMLAVTPDSDKMWIGTFHSICTKILRIFGNYMHIDKFTILDERKQIALIKKLSGNNIDYTKAKELLAKISAYKSALINPAKVMSDYCQTGKETYEFASLYHVYQEETWRNKTFDFDDLIVYTILLINSYPDVRNWIYENIKYVMTDELQDTSTDQFTLIRLLTGPNNIMAVGDFSQSIYGFRNAKPEYIGKFINMFPNTKQMTLEINYRSTQTIVNSANAVISHNSSGTKINMESAGELGQKIAFKRLSGHASECSWVASEIITNVEMGMNEYRDFAIINRTNMQANDFEDVFRQNGIPCVIVGGISFWNSAVTKDMIAFCRLVLNPKDSKSFERVLGITNGIGKTLAGRLVNVMEDTNDTCINVLHKLITNKEQFGRLHEKAVIGAESIIDIITSQRQCPLSNIVRHVSKHINYCYNNKGTFSPEKEEKVAELVRTLEYHERYLNSPVKVAEKVNAMMNTSEEEDVNTEINAVKIMTAHSCKGLEFDTVFVCGADEGLFPHYNATKAVNKASAIEEERRLFYVAMTRAKRKLYIVSSDNTSRFVGEIPKKYIESVF